MQLFRIAGFLLVLTCLSLVPGGLVAQVSLLPEEFERIDVIAIERDGRELYGFDALTGRRVRLRLELGEEVRFEGTRGRIGLVLTDRRALALAPGTEFRELRYQLREETPAVALVEVQVAIALTSRRALGFLGTSGVWVEADLSPNEAVAALRVGSAAGVVVTNRRALGLTPHRAVFVPVDLGVRETLESVTAQDAIVTIRTDRRILVFSAAQANWSEQDRRIR